MTRADVAEDLRTRALHRCTVGADTHVAKRFLDEQVNIAGVRVVIMRLGGVGARTHLRRDLARAQ